MAVKLRLMRMGKKKQPTYRVVAAESRKARNGRFIEIVGTYNPRQEPSLIEIDNERALHWLRHGAQPSERVQKLLVISGAWEEFTGVAGPAKDAPVIVTKAASAEEAAAEAVAEPTEAGQEPEAAAEAAAEPTEAGQEPEAAAEAAAEPTEAGQEPEAAAEAAAGQDEDDEKAEGEES